MSKTDLQDYMINRIGLASCVAQCRGYTNVNGVDKPYYEYFPPDYLLKVPCGKCAECRKSKRLQWSIRLINEIRSHDENHFITLTLDDASLKRFKKTPKKPLMLYIDRLRKNIGFRPKYFFVSELGETNNRLHYHGIIFGVSKDKLPFTTERDKWKYGHVWIGYCNDKTANYITKYILKDDVNYKPFILCSNGIGISYLDKKNISSWHINGFDFRDYINHNGTMYPLPVYYKNKLYNDDVKLVKMLNNVYDVGPFERYFNGITYTDKLAHYKALKRFYEWTLSQKLSIKPKFIDYGKLHFSKTRTTEDSTFESQFKFVQGSLPFSWSSLPNS